MTDINDHIVQGLTFWQHDPSGETDGYDSQHPTLAIEATHIFTGVRPGDTQRCVTLVVHEHHPGHGNWGIDGLATVLLSDDARRKLAHELLAMDEASKEKVVVGT